MKKFLCLLVSAVICINPLIISADNTEVIEEQAKFQSILENLSDNEENEIVIWTDDIDYDLIEKATYNITGLTKETITDDLGIEKIQDYINTKRKLAKQAYSAANNKFYSSAIQSTNSEVVFQSSYSPVFILKGTKSQLTSVLSDKRVKNSAICTDLEVKLFSDVASANTGAKYVRDTSGILGTGKGVVIGQFESSVPNVNKTVNSYSAFNKSKITLLNNNSSLDVDNDAINHSTLVAEIMVGQRVVYNGITYRGLAPDATLVSIGSLFKESADFPVLFSQIESLLDKGANIINSSYGISLPVKDGQFDGSAATLSNSVIIYNWFDHLAFNHDVHFVTAAGNLNNGTNDRNSGGLNCFGLSYNGICVGSVGDDNKTSSSYAPSTLSSQYNPNYTVSDFSSYVVPAYSTLINGSMCKPDIACFGENIRYGDLEGTGTSFAAPFVSGMVAQLASVYPSLLTNNSGIKALLAAGAVYRAKDTASADEKESSTELFEHQGAGVASAYCAYKSYSAGKINDLTLSGTTETYSFNINVPSGYSYLRVAMSWIRRATITGSHTASYPTDPGLANLDIHVIKDGKIVAMGEHVGNNLEVLQFPVTGSGTYTIKIFNRSYSEEHINYGNQYVSVAWY